MHRIVGCSGLVNKEGKLDLVDAPLFIVLHGKEFSYKKIEIRPGVAEEGVSGQQFAAVVASEGRVAQYERMLGSRELKVFSHLYWTCIRGVHAGTVSAALLH